MKTAKQYNWFIGLCTKDGSTLMVSSVMAAIAATMKFHCIPGFSVRQQTGFWNGVEEKSLMVSFVDTESICTFELAERIATNFRLEFEQECVMITCLNVDYYFSS
jgi:hypothetical protein